MDLKFQKRRYTECSEADVNNNKDKRVKKENINILQMHGDCLEKLFEFLQPKELGNIAAVHTHFGPSACYVFKKKYANSLITFDPFTSNGSIFNSFVNILDGFGDHIKRLQVTFYHEQRFNNRNAKILSLITEKCSKSVVELSLSNVQNHMTMKKPFLHLQKFTLCNSYLSDSLVDFIKNATNILSMDFYAVENAFNSKIIEHRLPLMKHFGNFNSIIRDSESKSLQEFRCFVSVNKQLTSLGIGEQELERMFRYEDVRQQFFKTINRKLPYSDHKSLITYLLPFESIYFGQLKQLSLSMGYSTDFLHSMRENRIEIANLPLQQLEYYVGHLNIESVDWILHCRHLEKFRLYVDDDIDAKQFTRAVLYLPKLIELDIFLLKKTEPEHATIQEIIMIIIEYLEQDSLEHERQRKFVIGFEIKRPTTYRNTRITYEKETICRYESFLNEFFVKKLSNQWRVSFETKNVEIKRQNSNKLLFLCVKLEKNIA